MTPRSVGPRCHKSGSSLVTTLLVIVVLTIIVTAFLQSMALERQTARSYLNRYRAQLAAEAGSNVAMLQVQDLFNRFPDSCTAWTNFQNSGAAGSEGTVFIYRSLPNTSGSQGAVPATPGAQIYSQPLVSGARATSGSALPIATVFDGGLTPQNSVNLNRNGAISGAHTNNPSRPFRAQWVEILEDPSLPRDETYDSATGRAVNGPVARFAYWVEDESFRVDINQAGATPRGLTSAGSSPSEIALQGVLEAVGAAATADEVVALRDSLPNNQILTPSMVSFADPASPSDYPNLRFYVTNRSASLNLSRGGIKRVNLNRVVQNINPSDANYSTLAREQLDRIIAAITNEQAMPDFGQRFYNFSLSSNGMNANNVTASHQNLYLQRIAANIRDYIDSDSQPTIVDNSAGFPVRGSDKPVAALNFNIQLNSPSENEAAAIGKEAVPGLHEYALRITLYTFAPPASTGGVTEAEYRMAIDHYFEVLNVYNKDIPLSAISAEGDGSDVFLRVYNQFAWDAGGGDSILPGRPLEIPLSDFVSFVNGAEIPFTEFPAGGVTVFTTDDSPSVALTGNPNAVYRPNAATLQRLEVEGRRIYQGVTTLENSNDRFRINPILGGSGGRSGSSSSDYDTHYLIGNSWGLLDSFTALSVPIDMSVNNENPTQTKLGPNNDNYFFRGGSLRGNSGSVSPQTGDPRSLNEQIMIQRYRSGGDGNQTRFYHSGLNNNSVPANSTFGIPNTNYVRKATWPDYSPDPISGADNAPAVVRDAPMESIGELGHIYDPHRILSPSNAFGASYARGGGKTLRVGQSDRFAPSPTSASSNLWDGNQTSVSRNRTAWRLADVFSTSDPESDGLVISGKININGVNRDNGTALRAALFGLRFSAVPDGDAGLANREVQVNQLVSAINTRLSAATADPFWERGEISELSVFSSGTQLTGQNMATAVDRGREELSRRLLELITTRGSVFTVHCIGQSVSIDKSGGTRVLSTDTRKVTFEIVPVYDTPLPDDDEFVPNINADGTVADDDDRFRTPDRFEVVVLSADTI